MSSFLNRIILIISSLGLFVSIYLIYREFSTPGFCPQIFNIPACYIIFVSFLLIAIANITPKKIGGGLLFFIGSVSGLALSGYFSFNQLQGQSCLILFNFPMCYVSLITFLVLIILKLLLTAAKKHRV